MAAMVLASPRAVQVSVYVVRAFVRLREAALQHKDLAKRLDTLEEKTEALAMQHDAFSRNTAPSCARCSRRCANLPCRPSRPRGPSGSCSPRRRRTSRSARQEPSRLAGI